MEWISSQGTHEIDRYSQPTPYEAAVAVGLLGRAAPWSGAKAAYRQLVTLAKPLSPPPRVSRDPDDDAVLVCKTSRQAVARHA